MQLRRKRTDLAVTALIVAGTLFLLWNTRTFAPSLLPGYPGDAFFPRIVLTFMLLCAAAVIFDTLTAHRKAGKEDAAPGQIQIDVRGLAIVSAFVVGYIVVFSTIGFEIASFLFLTGLLRGRLNATGMRAWVTAALVSAAAVLILYVCFVLLLGVDMPLLFLPQYINF